MEEHPIQQAIRAIDLDVSGNSYVIGRNGVTRIEACQKSGLHANLPYVRVWKGDVCEAEFCQHNIVGVYFVDPEPEFAEVYASCGHPVGAAECMDCLPF